MSNGYDQEAMDARANELCEICGIRVATEWNHCLVNKDKRFPILNRIYNLQHVCHPCHTDTGHTRKNRSAFWWSQFCKYEDEFLEWWDEVLDTLVRNLGYEGLRMAADEYAEERLGADGLT